MVTSKPPITEKEPPPTAKGGGGGWDDVLNRLQARSVARASEAIEAAQEAGHTVEEVDRLIRHFDAQQSEHNPPRAGLLVAWLRGSQPWPIINDLPPDRPRRQRTSDERMRNEMMAKRRELQRIGITGSIRKGHARDSRTLPNGRKRHCITNPTKGTHGHVKR